MLRGLSAGSFLLSSRHRALAMSPPFGCHLGPSPIIGRRSTSPTRPNDGSCIRFRGPLVVQLEPTADEAVRVCETCWRQVFHCRTDAEALYHAMEGHCVAVLMPDTSQLLGEPMAGTI